MTRYIVPAEVEKIAREADIAEIIAEYVPLTRSGQSYKGLCPFHSEKTPSFVVSPEKRVFHCFGCGAGGNVFTFIMKWDGVDFPTAVQTIATKIGLSISTDERTTGHKERMYHSAERVCSFYQRMLQRNTTANNYLKQRGLRPEITSVFRLGWAPESRQFLDFCQKSGLPNPLLQKLGLIRQNPEGSSYAYFRRRLIFPVLTWSGKVTGFGARVLDNSTPKYLNSPQSPIFSKGQMLYGLHLAREHIRHSGQAILVEGYMDVIALHQVDIKNAVASLGTALTPSQVTLLKRYANTVTLAFDEDSAGQIATVKGIDLLLEQGLNVRILSLPQGKDPAEAMQHGEKDSFIRQLQSATDYIDYRIKTAVEQNSPLTTQNKLKVIGTLLPTLNLSLIHI